MAIDYDVFRSFNWEQRVRHWSSLSPVERAELVRSQISGWLERHRAELTTAQIEILEGSIAFLRPEVYESPKDAALVAEMKSLEKRAAAVLTHEQFIEALTMQWGLSCRV